MHVVITVNAAWNVMNFRKPVVVDLLKQGHRVTVLAPPDDHIEQLKALGCEFVALHMDVKGLSPLESVRLVKRMRRHFRDLRPDIVLSYTIKNNIFGALAAKSLGLPFVPNVTGLGTAFLSSGALRFVAETLYRSAFRHLPVVFFQNSDDRDLFVHRGLIKQEQARVLPGSGIDTDHFAWAPLPSKNDKLTFLMIARLLRDKGVIEYVNAAKIVKLEFPDVKFQLLGALGTANRTAITATEVDAWHEEGAIDYKGAVLDVRLSISAADCVVLPSYREGAPRTLIEAASMGRVLVATDVPGCRHVVQEGKTGFLCAPQDSDSLAKACLKVIEQGVDRRAKMGQAARRHMVAEYDETRVVDAYRRVVRHVMDKTG